MRNILVLAAAVFAACSCSHRITIVQRNPPPTTDIVAECTQACAKASTVCGLGGDCVGGCQRDQEQGIAAQLDPQCVIDAGTPAAMIACGVPCSAGGH